MAPQATNRRVAYFYDERISVHASMEASLLKPHIVRLSHELITAYGLNKNMTMCACRQQWSPLTAQDAGMFHTDAYVQFLQLLDYNGLDAVEDAPNFVLNPSVTFCETTWEYSSIYAGASVAAASMLTQGSADIAINWMGGQTHARRDCASGFSYLNDAVLAIVTLLKAHERVMFVNLDAWHASGVEEAFFTTDRVLCVSLHRYGEGLFPGSGGAADVGEDAGKHHTVNVPVTDGFDDADCESVLLPILQEAAARFQPHAVVCCAGAGVIAADRLGCLNMTLSAHSAVLEALVALERPLLVLGSGGYTQLNAARTFCNATATLCGVQLPEAIPPHVFREDYLPDYKLTIPPAVMANKNTAESLEATKAAAMETISQMPARPPTKPVNGSQMAPLPGAGAAETVKTEAAPAEAVKEEAANAAAEGDAVKAEGAEGGAEAAAAEALKEEPMDVDADAAAQGNGGADDGAAMQAEDGVEDGGADDSED